MSKEERTAFTWLMEKLFPPTELDMEDVRAKGLLFPITILNVGVFLGLLIGIFIKNYQDQMGKEFLSVAGNSSSQTCFEVPLAITAVFHADRSGYWNTDPRSKLNESIFELRMDGSSIDLDQYQTTMRGFASRLKLLGTKLKNRDTVWGSIAWSTLLYQNPSTMMTFTTNAEPNIIMQDALIWDNKAWSQRQSCTAPAPVVTPDASTKRFTVDYSISWPGTISNPAADIHLILNQNVSVSCSSVCGNQVAGGVPLTCSSTSQALLSAMKTSSSRYTYTTPSSAAGPILADSKNTYIPSTIDCGPAHSFLSSNPAITYKDANGVISDVATKTLTSHCPCVPLYQQPCGSTYQIAPDFGYTPTLPGLQPGKFSLRFDTRSLFVASAINTGIITLADLQRVTYKAVDTKFRASIGQPDLPPIMFYTHQKFLPMTPLVCFNKEWIGQWRAGPAAAIPTYSQYPDFEFCLVIDDAMIGQHFSIDAFPIFSSGSWHGVEGIGNPSWKSCLCSATPQDTESCNGFNGKIDLVLGKNAATGVAYYYIIKFGLEMARMRVSTTDGDELVMENLNNNVNTYCGKACFVMTFAMSKDPLVNFLPINSNGLDLAILSRDIYFSQSLVGGKVVNLTMPKTFCTDMLYYDDVIDRMISTPPIALTASYTKCKNTVSGALVSSFGSAAGTSQLLSTTFMTALIAAVVFIYNHIHAKSQEERIRRADVKIAARFRDYDERMGIGGVGKDMALGNVYPDRMWNGVNMDGNVDGQRSTGGIALTHISSRLPTGTLAVPAFDERRASNPLHSDS